MKQYSRDNARKWILEILAKQLSVKGQEPDKREFKLCGGEELQTAVSVGMESRRKGVITKEPDESKRALLVF